MQDKAVPDARGPWQLASTLAKIAAVLYGILIPCLFVFLASAGGGGLATGVMIMISIAVVPVCLLIGFISFCLHAHFQWLSVQAEASAESRWILRGIATQVNEQRQYLKLIATRRDMGGSLKVGSAIDKNPDLPELKTCGTCGALIEVAEIKDGVGGFIWQTYYCDKCYSSALAKKG